MNKKTRSPKEETMEKIREVLREIRGKAEAKFNKNYPYITVSLRLVKERTDGGGRGRNALIDLLIEKLRETYRVGKDGDWLIIEKEP